MSFKIHDIPNIVAVISGVCGGAAALIQESQRKHVPLKVGKILGRLLVASFAAWVAAMLMPDTIHPNVATGICGIAGYSGGTILDTLEDSILRFFGKVDKGE